MVTSLSVQIFIGFFAALIAYVTHLITKPRGRNEVIDLMKKKAKAIEDIEGSDDEWALKNNRHWD